MLAKRKLVGCLWHPEADRQNSTCRVLEFARCFRHALPHLCLLPAKAAKRGRLTVVMAILQMGKQSPQD